MEAQDNTAPLWKPRKRKWPNGREYWIVSDGKGRVLTSDNLLESHFSDRAHAQFWADAKNADNNAHQDYFG